MAKERFFITHGIVAAIAVTNGNVLDVEVMSRQCKSSLKNAPLKDSDPEQYKIWRAGHHLKCNNLNYVGSGPNMERTGAVKMFERSLQNYGLRYLKFYGDGDSKGFNAVESICEGVKVAKLECIGHYQKRVGNRLRKLRKRIKGLGGQAKQKEGGKVTKTKVKAKSRLTDALIDKLQNYFGIALQSSAKTVPELKKHFQPVYFMSCHQRVIISTHIAQLVQTVGVNINVILSTKRTYISPVLG